MIPSTDARLVEHNDGHLIFSPVVIVSEADSGSHRKLRFKSFPEKSKAMFPKLVSRDARHHVFTGGIGIYFTF